MRFGAVMAIIIVALGYLAYTGVQDSKSYYVTIKELNGMGNSAYSKRLRVAGNVQPGSIKRQGTHLEFQLVEQDRTLACGLQRDRSSARHLQGQRAGAGGGKVRTRWRFPRHQHSGQVRIEVRSQAAGTAGSQRQTMQTQHAPKGGAVSGRSSRKRTRGRSQRLTILPACHRSRQSREILWPLCRAARHFGELRAGRLYVVVGDNGAGKSTLLRVIAGLMEPSQGSFTLLGAKNVREVAHRVGYMGHAPLLYDELSGMENLRYFAGLYGIHDDEVSRNAMRMVGLDPDLARRVGQYSQGMRQRLSLARAVLHDPELMLLDEPFSNVDVRSARDMAAVLGRVRDQGKTIFVVTHQAPLMESVADEFVHMSAGQIVAREDDGALGGCSAIRAEGALMSTFGVTRATLVKDLRMEWRSKDAINSMLFFALLVVVIFSFAFNPTAEESRHIAGGLIWVAFLFAAVVALNQTWARELRNQVLDAYRVSPAPPNALFLAKTHRQLSLRRRAGMPDGAAVRRLLRAAVGRAGVAVGCGRAAGDVGAGGEWNILRGALDSHPQPRDHAAADSVSHFDSGAAGHGGRNHVDPDRRRLARFLDQAAGGLRCRVYVGLPAAV